MWCAACRADVAAELSSDNRRMLCARCHCELGLAAGADRYPTTPKSQDTERNARELLARWSTQHLLEPPISAGQVGTLEPANAPVSRTIAEPASRRAVHRFDGPQASVAPPLTPVSEFESKDSDRDAVKERPRRRKVDRPRIADAPVDSQEPRHNPVPDDLVKMAIQHPHVRQGNWTTTIGQLCAYGGVAVLTLGTVMVLSGYFGGPANYAPTGWLVAAVGQMLLFLGVVTLVSGGMEQTVDEVSWRIDHLAEQIFHLEQVINDQQSQLMAANRRKNRRSKAAEDGHADAA